MNNAEFLRGRIYDTLGDATKLLTVLRTGCRLIGSDCGTFLAGGNHTYNHVRLHLHNYAHVATNSPSGIFFVRDTGYGIELVNVTCVSHRLIGRKAGVSSSDDLFLLSSSTWLYDDRDDVGHQSPFSGLPELTRFDVDDRHEYPDHRVFKVSHAAYAEYSMRGCSVEAISDATDGIWSDSREALATIRGMR